MLLLALACAGAAPCRAAPAPRLAVFELRDEAALGASDAAYLTDRVRAHARQELPPGMIILTRESLFELIPKNVRLEDCGDAACDLEAGRKLGVDYIVSGELLRFAGELRLNLKAHAVASGAFLAGETVAGSKPAALETGLEAACRKLFAAVRAHVEPPAPAPAPAPVVAVEPVWVPPVVPAPTSDPARAKPQEPAKRVVAARSSAEPRDSLTLASLGLVRRGDLIWCSRDNGAPLTWAQAWAYADTCTTGGFRDWRLPTVAELATLYDESRLIEASQRAYEVGVVAPFVLSTACMWSREPNGPEHAYLFFFDDGARYALKRTDRDCGRALCVRDAR